MIEGGRPLRVR